MSSVKDRIETTEEAYGRDSEDDRPLRAYAGLLGAYGATAAILTLLGRHRLPGRLRAADLALGSITTFKVARVLTEDPVTSPIRAPFTRYQGVAGPAELNEEVRGQGWRHAVGELLTCPFCLAQWVATTLVVGTVAAPRFTRTAMSIFTMVTAADFLQLAYARAEQLGQGTS